MGRKGHRNQKKSFWGLIIVIIFLAISVAFGEDFTNIAKESQQVSESKTNTYFNVEDIPEYIDKIYIEINNNEPYFTESDYTTEAFEKYSELDDLGRCGVAYANSGKIKRIATGTFIITPYNVDSTGDDLLDELESSGVYF